MKHSLPIASLLVSLALVACSSSTTTGDGGTDSGTDSTSPPPPPPPPPPPGDSGTDAPVTPDPPLNGCTTYVDLTADAAKREIPWDFPVTSAPEHCMKIKVGQTVKWNGNRNTHPLAASGGDSPNPITDADTVTFPKAGVFGYICSAHPNMKGAIVVVP